jgi:putative hydrolase of the HAD superfamily
VLAAADGATAAAAMVAATATVAAGAATAVPGQAVAPGRAVARVAVAAGSGSMPVEAGVRFSGVEAVCLDLDDTLVDARGAWHAGFAEAIGELREALPELAALGSAGEIYDRELRPLMMAAQRAAGSSEWSHDFARQGLRELLGRFDVGPADADAVLQAYLEAWPRHVEVFPETREVLGALRGRYALALISNGLGHDQRLKVDAQDLGGYFDALVISEEVGATKPDPRIFAHALEALGVAAGVALHAGDNPHHDVAGARAAGLLGVWVRRPGGRFESDGEADAVVADLRELVELLG